MPDFSRCRLKPPEGYPQSQGQPVCINGSMCRDPEHGRPAPGEDSQ